MILRSKIIISLNFFLCTCLAQEGILEIKKYIYYSEQISALGIYPSKFYYSISNKFLLLDESNNEFLELNQNGHITRPSGLGINNTDYGDIVWLGISQDGIIAIDRLENEIIYLDYRLSYLHTIPLGIGIYPDLVSLDIWDKMQFYSKAYNSVFQYENYKLSDIPFIDLNKEHLFNDCFLDMESNRHGDLALLGCDGQVYEYSVNGKAKNLSFQNLENARFIIPIDNDWLIFNNKGVGVAVNSEASFLIPETSIPIIDIKSNNNSISILSRDHILILNVK